MKNTLANIRILICTPDNPATNWYDQVFGHVGTTFNQDLSITGGSEKFKYAFSYAGLKSNEIMLNSKLLTR